MTKKQTFLRVMRYVAVAVVTVWLLVLFIASTDEDDFLAAFMVVAAIVAFFFTIPIIGFWIYSFVKSISRHTKTDRILLWFHIVDMLLLGSVVYMLNRPPMKCDAFIMAECYNGEPVFWMWNTADHYRNMLPDSSRLVVEFENGNMPQSDILSEFEMKQLKKLLNYLGCIGIDVNNYSNSEYSTIRFRRMNMGMYSYRLYNHPLSHKQQDSINADPCLIVYNDSTVFEFSAVSWAHRLFPANRNFLKRLKEIKNNETAQ